MTATAAEGRKAPPGKTTSIEKTAAVSPDKVASQIAYLARALKTPTIGRVWSELAGQARDENWSHEEYLATVLARQNAERESAGTTMRIRTAHFPQVKTLEDFNLDHLPSLRRGVLAHLATDAHPEDGERDPARPTRTGNHSAARSQPASPPTRKSTRSPGKWWCSATASNRRT